MSTVWNARISKAPGPDNPASHHSQFWQVFPTQQSSTVQGYFLKSSFYFHNCKILKWKQEVQKGVSGVNPLLVKLRKLSFCSSPPPLPSSPIWAAVDIGGEFIVLRVRGRCDCCCDPWEGNHKVEMHCDKNLLLLFTQSGDRWGGWVISKLLQHSIVRNHECWKWYYMNDHTCYFKGIASSCFASDLL